MRGASRVVQMSERHQVRTQSVSVLRWCRFLIGVLNDNGRSHESKLPHGHYMRPTGLQVQAATRDCLGFLQTAVRASHRRDCLLNDPRRRDAPRSH